MKFSLSVKMATTGGSSIVVPSIPLSSYIGRDAKASSSTLPLGIGKIVFSQRHVSCFAVQKTSASTSNSAVSANEKKKETAPKEESPAQEAAPEKPKPQAKAKPPTKQLSQLMEEDVIPSLKAILEAQDDISELELSFGDNRLEGSFLKKGNPYSFWAFFPDGNVTGPKGFSLSSYGSPASSVEPFLVDEKKITAKLLVFWVEKRLAAQGIIPVWKE